MHHDQIETDVGLVRDLVASQHPRWTHHPVRPVTSTGTAHAMYRLGDDMVVRLPLRPSGAGAVRKEHRWLPVLAPRLPVAIPAPIAIGEPTEAYPMPWTIHPWFDGEDATTADFDRGLLAEDVAHFLAALTSIDPDGGPRPNPDTHGRGVPLATRDRYTREAIAASRHLTDTKAVTAVWDEALRAPTWDRAGVWVHGDIASGNLILRGGSLQAVIDFSSVGVGDPACDLIIAWELFDRGSRAVLRSVLGVDDATWARARGWAVSTAIVALPYYEHTNRFMAEQARRKLALLLDG